MSNQNSFSSSTSNQEESPKSDGGEVELLPDETTPKTKKSKKERPKQSALSRAAWYLGRREYSKKELYDVLIRKEFPPEESQKAVDTLAERGWQSDERTAKMLLNRGKNHRYGPNRIARDAKNKGLSSEVIEQALENTEDNWFAQAQEAAERKFGKAPYTYDIQVKVAAFLMRKGYNLDMCWKVAKNQIQEDE